MWGYLLPMCFCVATTPLIMSQHSQVVTLFQMPQKWHEKYPCTKIFIPSFFSKFSKIQEFLPSENFSNHPLFLNFHPLKISTWKISTHSGLISIKMPTFSKFFIKNHSKNYEISYKKILQISPHSWFESMKVWFSRNFFVGQLFTGLFVCWVSLLLRILSFLRFYGCLKIIFWDFFQKFLNTNRSR